MPSGGKKKHKRPSRKKSELDSALGQVGDESVAAATQEFQDLLGEAKGDTRELIRQNAEDVERRLVLLKKRQSQKRDLRVFVDGQPAQAQERAEKLTIQILEIAAKVAIALI